MIPMIVLALVLGLFALYVLSPFFTGTFRRKQIPAGPGDVEDLYYRKEEILSAIEDLKYDYQISEADYLQMSDKLSREAVEVMKRIDQRKGANTDAKAGDPGGRRTADRVGS
jgi:hypothetical protein